MEHPQYTQQTRKLELGTAFEGTIGRTNRGQIVVASNLRILMATYSPGTGRMQE